MTANPCVAAKLQHIGEIDILPPLVQDNALCASQGLVSRGFGLAL